MAERKWWMRCRREKMERELFLKKMKPEVESMRFERLLRPHTSDLILHNSYFIFHFMADISSNFLGIRSPNPFWLASAPPTDKKMNVLRAFEAGWGGVVWKTLGSQVKNVSSRYSSVDYGGERFMGFFKI